MELFLCFYLTINCKALSHRYYLYLFDPKKIPLFVLRIYSIFGSFPLYNTVFSKLFSTFSATHHQKKKEKKNQLFTSNFSISKDATDHGNLVSCNVEKLSAQVCVGWLSQGNVTNTLKTYDSLNENS